MLDSKNCRSFSQVEGYSQTHKQDSEKEQAAQRTRSLPRQRECERAKLGFSGSLQEVAKPSRRLTLLMDQQPSLSCPPPPLRWLSLPFLPFPSFLPGHLQAGSSRRRPLSQQSAQLLPHWRASNAAAVAVCCSLLLCASVEDDVTVAAAILSRTSSSNDRVCVLGMCVEAATHCKDALR